MKKQLMIYAVLVLGYILYNQFVHLENERIHTAINILYASVLFLYIGFLAFTLLRKLKNRSNK